MTKKTVVKLLLILLIGILPSCSRRNPWDNTYLYSLSNLSYSASSAVYTRNIAITNNIPTVTGNTTLWSVTPSLPAGLSIDSATGIISGTPTTKQSIMGYTITASNSKSSVSTTIFVTIISTYRYFLYFGNNYNGIFGDIYQYEMNMTTGDLTYITSGDSGHESSGLAVDPSSKYLYSEQPSGNAIRSFVIASNGSLGSVATWNLGYSPDGMISVHPNGNFLYGTSLAGSDIYDVNIKPDGSLGSVAGSSNSLTNAPKVFAIKSTGEFAYVVNYNNNTINRYLIDAATGSITTPITALDIIGTGAFPQAIAIHPTMDYLYVVTDSAQTIQCYSINSGTGLLTVNGGTVTTSGQGDSCLVIDPSGKYLYSINSWYPSTIDAYKINPADGTLSMIGGSPYPVPKSTAASIVMQYAVIDPTGKYLYGTIYDGTGVQGFVEGYSINQSTGELTHLNNWTYPHYYATNPVIAVIEQ